MVFVPFQLRVVLAQQFADEVDGAADDGLRRVPVMVADVGCEIGIQLVEVSWAPGQVNIRGGVGDHIDEQFHFRLRVHYRDVVLVPAGCFLCASLEAFAFTLLSLGSDGQEIKDLFQHSA